MSHNTMASVRDLYDRSNSIADEIRKSPLVDLTKKTVILNDIRTELIERNAVKQRMHPILISKTQTFHICKRCDKFGIGATPVGMNYFQCFKCTTTVDECMHRIEALELSLRIANARIQLLEKPRVVSESKTNGVKAMLKLYNQ
jgi:hypothetical protein